MNLNSNRIMLFDSIKGIAIIGIMCIHLGSWCFPDLPSGCSMSVVRSSGALGVELTFLINAFLYSQNYIDRVIMNREISTFKYILKMFISLAPVYYLGLVLYTISAYYSYLTFQDDALMVISHFLFLNGITPSLFAGFMGGTGYFGVLAIMWLLYPFYIRTFNTVKLGILGGGGILCLTKILRISVMYFNEPQDPMYTDLMLDWILYINRALYCFALGHLLYLCCENICIKINNKLNVMLSCLCLLFIMWICFFYGRSIHSVYFSLLWCIIIFLYKKWNRKSLICNEWLAFFGKNITELFICHVVLYYIMVEHWRILSIAGNNNIITFLTLIVISILIAPLLKLYWSKPIVKFVISKTI